MAKVDDSIWDQFEDLDTVKVSGQADKFKMTNKDDKARIAFPLVNPKTKKIALKKVLKFNYSGEGTWANFQAPTNENGKAYKLAVQHCGEPQVVYVTPILVYSTNKDGRIINGEEYQLTNLVLPRQRLQEIKSLQEEYDLANIDLIATCTETKYQAIKFTPAKECGFIAGAITVRKNGEEKKLKISIDQDEVIQAAIDMSKESDLAVAPRWSEQAIIDYFSKDDNSDFDDEDDEDEPTPPKSESQPQEEDEDYGDFEDDDEEL